MKVQLISDLHLEMQNDYGKSCLNAIKPMAPLLIVAGDTTQAIFSSLGGALSYFCSLWDYVIYVAGNHEYYSSTPDAVTSRLREHENFYRNLAIVDRFREVVFKSKKFLCGTMWFPDDPLNDFYRSYLSDFSHIGGFTPWVYEQNRLFTALLEKNVSKGDVVITHHLPSSKSVPPKYATSPLNRFFVTDMERIIYEKQPSFWFHGHTHAACDYFIEKTRIVANPHGYLHEDSVLKFNPNLVVNV